jgi:hypothetical protein
VGSFFRQKAYDAHNFRQEIATLVAEESDLNRRYAAISATFPQLGVDNDTLRRLTNRYDELRALQRQPAPSFTMLSHVLDRMPAIILESLDWKNGTFCRRPQPSAKGRKSSRFKASFDLTEPLPGKHSTPLINSLKPCVPTRSIRSKYCNVRMTSNPAAPCGAAAKKMKTPDRDSFLSK